MPEDSLHVAIIGGGLCGLSLAIALTKRNISFTLYEARSSFTEIGAGINISPNAHQTFQLLDPAIADALFSLATRNEPGKEDIWMTLTLGAASGDFDDGHVLHELLAPPTGNTTASRNELLQLLAGSIDVANARFNKKLHDLRQDDGGVTLVFEDGTEDRASLVIGCDGAHSTVRRLLLGADNPATLARFSQTGGYRAIFPIQLQEELVGERIARNSTLFLGPEGYLITYPIDGGKNVNIGLWPKKPIEWRHDDSWVLPNQRQEMLKDFTDWGPLTQKIMEKMGNETAFWATFHHIVKPNKYFDGRIIMIGDAAHAMCPHQGQGAAQSMEDAYVMSEVLSSINTTYRSLAESDRVEAGLQGYSSVRVPRFEKCLDTSSSSFFDIWCQFWKPGLTERDISRLQEQTEERFRWLWEADVEGQGRRAKAETSRILEERANSQGVERARLA
jgi:salicylate hydroxylase